MVQILTKSPFAHFVTLLHHHIVLEIASQPPPAIHTPAWCEEREKHHERNQIERSCQNFEDQLDTQTLFPCKCALLLYLFDTTPGLRLLFTLFS